MSTPDASARIAERVRDLRVARGLSQSALARAAGIGKGSLSELEAGQRNPTLATLYALAGTLHVPLAALLDDTVGAEVSGEGLTAHLLDVRTSEGRTVESYAMRFAPGSVRRSPAHGAGVVEHLVVTRGTLRFGAPGRLQTSASGEHGRFDADRPHTYEVLGDEPAEAVLVILTPHENSVAAEGGAP